MVPRKITLTMPFDYANGDKVAVIKSIRWLTNMGLKEAKDLSEKSGPSQVEIRLPQHDHNGNLINTTDFYRQNVQVLEECGVKVFVSPTVRDELVEELRKLTVNAVLKGDTEFAEHAIKLLRTLE